MTATDTVPAAGRRTPARGRPSELDDRQWLRKEYAIKSERQIAKELGCARETVRKAIRDWQIPAASVGRRRGGNPGRRAVDQTKLPDAIRLIGERFSDDPAAPTNTTIRTRLVDLHHAHGRREDRIIALVELGSAIALNLEHELLLRRAP